MTISSMDNLISSAKQYASLIKTGSRTTVAANWFSVAGLAGNPGAGTLAGASLTPGVIETDATAGYPAISTFGVGSTGYLAQVDFGSSVACRMKLFDCIWKGGAYPFNANQAVTFSTVQAAYDARMPGASYGDAMIFLEQVTAGTGTQSVAVTYTNQAGTTGRTTGTVATAQNIAGRLWNLPLQAGDTGVSAITNITGTGATVGTFNILIMRPLWSGRVRIANDGDVHDFAKTGMPIIFDNSALYLALATDGTTSGVPELEFVIANA